jgi:hypothetical protein
MGVQLGNVSLRRSRRQGDVLPTGRALPELDPTQPAKMVPFQAGANNMSCNALKKKILRRYQKSILTWRPNCGVFYTGWKQRI